jgi:hypothetical protein
MKILLLSYPRSGNTWCRYILEFLTGYPSIGRPELLNPSDLHGTGTFCPENFEGDIIFKAHGQDSTSRAIVQKCLDNGYTLLFLVRSPIEALTRHMGVLTPSDLKDFDDPREYYFTNIETFDSYTGPKKILYYEDMIQHPRNFVNDVTAFLNVEDATSKIEKFMNDFEVHRRSGRDFYQRDNPSKCHTTGMPDSVNFHSKKYSSSFIQTMWIHMKDYRDPKIMKYIERYEKP